MLAQEGFNAVFCENGSRALKLMRSTPDLVLLDLMLPGMNGIEGASKFAVLLMCRLLC